MNMYVKQNIDDVLYVQNGDDIAVYWLIMRLYLRSLEYSLLSLCLGSPWSKPIIVNFNKLPKVTSTPKGFREFEHSALHVGDFNSYHSQ